MSQDTYTRLWFVGSSECEQSGLNYDQEKEDKFHYDEDLEEYTYAVSKPALLPMFDQNFVSRVVCGGMHTLVILQNGELYSWGCNDDSVLGRPGDGTIPDKVDLEGFVLQISAGDSHSMAITLGGDQMRDRKIFVWGTYRDANGNVKEPIKEPHQIQQKNLGTPVKICSGQNHSILMWKDKYSGFMYCWGDSDMNKIGRKVRDNGHKVKSMLKITRLGQKGVSDIWACGNHSFAKTRDPRTNEVKLYAWGLNRNGQLGLGHCEDFNGLDEVEFFDDKEVLQICGGDFHTLFLTTDFNVYGAGANRDGQCGIPSEIAREIMTPMQIPQLLDIKSISSGQDFNYAIGHNGDIYNWGSGQNFVLLNGCEEDHEIPRPIPENLFDGDEVCTIACGGNHMMVLSKPAEDPQEKFVPKPAAKPKKRRGKK